MGAAMLCATGCLYGGAGLTTASIPASGLTALNTALPEVISPTNSRILPEVSSMTSMLISSALRPHSCSKARRLPETQGATVALPAELRATSTSPTAGRDESVQRLVKAADSHDDENFRDRTAQLAASQSCPDLRDSKLGWFDEVKSTRVTCG